MPAYDTLQNHGEYFASHYFAEQLTEDLKKGPFRTWSLRESDPVQGTHRETPRKRLADLRGQYFNEKTRTFFAERAGLEAGDGGGQRESAYTFGDPDWRERITAWHRSILTALGFDDADGPVDLPVHHAGRDFVVGAAYHGHGIVALDCGWTDKFDGALDPQGPARLLSPLKVTNAEQYPDGASLASLLLHADEVGDGGQAPRFVLLLLGGVIVLADQRSFGEGRYLAANLDGALSRADASKTGEIPTIAALFSRELLEPGENGEGPALDALLKASTQNAAEVTDELRDGLRESVETLANEVLARLEKQNVTPDQLDNPRVFARQLTRECLRYLYRILFLLYAESRPELGILPSGDDAYEAGYSVARLRELVQRDERLTSERSRNGTHLYDSLALLFEKVNLGHRMYGTEESDDRPGDDEETRRKKAEKRSEDRGLRFEQLNSDLFAPEAIRLIGTTLEHPLHDEDDPGSPATLDTRLRNEALHKVLRKLTITKGTGKQRGGFISYRNLGINQLGAVYEGLMSYTGFIATEELYEVAKKGNSKDGSWMVPARKIDQYPDEVFVKYPADDPDRRTGRKRYQRGEFVYRLSGRDRQTSASYYTPESLTKLTVELALRERVDQDKDEHGKVRAGAETRASELLKYKICEPALGSGAFLNEAINQVAAEYLRRRQDELKTTIPTSEYLTEFQKAKAYIALHNSYGVDLNATAVELAEVSLWLNTMHPGMRAPWFGLHLRRGNSLIGGRRAVYAAEDVAGRQWFASKDTLPPIELPFIKDGEEQALPQGAVHQFLLPAVGWASIVGEKEARDLAPEQAARLKAWRTGILKAPSTKAKRGAKSQLGRLQGLAERAEYLWGLVVRRMELSEEQIARKIDVWGADPTSEEFAFLKQPKHPVPKEKVYTDLFEAVGTPYWRLKTLMDTWCALWFWPLDKADLLDGTHSGYDVYDAHGQGLSTPQLPELAAVDATREVAREVAPIGLFEQDALFGDVQGTIVSAMESSERFTTALKVGSKKSVAPKPRPVRRTVIALNDLNDWIDFAEALLGVTLPENTLADQFESLAELEDHEDVLPEFMGMDTENQLSSRFPWLDAIQEIAEEQGFFHWELSFAYTFAKNGGFDLQVGNPPWVRPDWTEDLVLAEFEPWFALAERARETERKTRRGKLLELASPRSYWHSERVVTTAVADFLSDPTTYRLIAGTRPDLYRCFMIHAWASCSRFGTVGLIHPDTHFTGTREGRLRAAAYCSLRFHAHFANERKIFKDIDYHVPFGLHVYGYSRAARFVHVSWLFETSTLKESLIHDGTGELPGIKHEGTWDIRPHKERLVTVDDDVLHGWASLAGEINPLGSDAALLYPLTTSEAAAISILATVRNRLVSFKPWISRGFDEKGAKESGYIEWASSDVPSWSEVVLQGPHFHVATPLNKQPNIPCRSNKDYEPWDLTTMPLDAVPRTNYRRVGGLELSKYVDSQDTRNGSSYSSHYRLAWRRMISQSSVRSLFAALIPPGPTHVDAVNSLILDSDRDLALLGGMWASILVDYYLRISGHGDMRVAVANSLPAPQPDHPLARPLLMRSARLNCLTSAYADLWREIYEPEWQDEQWAVAWPGSGIQPLNNTKPEWRFDCALRTESERRAALVEIDALIAVWFGVSVDQFMAIYFARYGVLSSYEADMYFDAHGRQITREYYGQGVGQASDTYATLIKHLGDPDNVTPPEGYEAPFYKADREREMREAHAVFQRRLDEAVARGDWDPVTQTVPQREVPSSS